jgi:hypothetical protein
VAPGPPLSRSQGAAGIPKKKTAVCVEGDFPKREGTFPVANGEDFRDLFLAIAASPPDAPKPTPIERFMAAHPAAPAALATVATPDSFADEAYFGVNAFVLADKAGHRQAVRQG